MAAARSAGRRALGLGLKIALVGGLFWYLAQKGLLSVEAMKRALGRPDLIGPAATMILLSSFLGAVRWQWLLGAQGIRIPFLRTVQLVYIGNFFNIALPGAVSGDFVKAFYVANEAKGLRGRAFGSILFDRIVGLSALVMVSAGALIIDLDALSGTPLLRAIRLPVLLAAFGFLSFYLYLFLVREKRDPLMLALRSAETKAPRVGSFTRIYEGVRHYRSHRWTVVKALVLSILIHVMVASSCLLFAHAFGETSIERLAVYVIVPLGLLVTAVPVLPGGVGTGHAAFAFLFAFLGSQRGGDVFSLNVLMSFAIGAVGGLVYLRYKSERPIPVLETERAESPARS
jgi:uncharacterized protein (TIRG00374 family)